MAAYHLAVGRDEFASGFGDLLALLFEIGGDELLVIAAGNEADFLRVGLFGEGETTVAGDVADLGLGEMAERKKRTRELWLGEAEEEVGLVLCSISRPLQDPPPAAGVVFIDGVVAGGDTAGADAAGGLNEGIELEVVVAERAGDGRAAMEILVDEGADDVLLEAGLLVDDVVGDAEVLGYAAGVVDIIEGAAAAGLGSIRDAVLAREARLVPELKGQADDCRSVLREHGRNC